jgi:hypothetical protein
MTINLKKVYSGKFNGEWGFFFSPNGLDPYVELTPEQHDALFKNKADGQIIKWHEDGTPYIGEPDPLLLEDMVKLYGWAVSGRLDAFSRGRDYDTIDEAATYRDDANPLYAREGAYCHKMRGLTWTKYDEAIALVRQETIPPPAIDDFLAMMPILEWPE